MAHRILPVARLPELLELQRIQDKALGFPLRPYHYPSLVQCRPGEADVLHYSEPEPDQKRARFALRLADLDPDALPEEFGGKLEPLELETLRVALRAREEKPADWAETKLEPTPEPLEPTR